MMHLCDNCPMKNREIRVWPLVCACGKRFNGPDSEGTDKPEPKPRIPQPDRTLRGPAKHYVTLIEKEWICDRIHNCACCTKRKGIYCDAIRKKTGKAGIIMHRRGVLRHESHCPEGRW